MIIACPACATRYVVPDSAIGVEGRTVRCAKCRHSWFQDGPVLDLATAPEAAPPPAEPTPAPPPPVEQEEPAAPPPVEEHYEEPQAEPPPYEEPQTAGPPYAEPYSEPPRHAEPPPAEEQPSPPPPDYDAPTPAVVETAPAPPPVEEEYYDHSQFEYEPPFRPRRNPLKLWTAAALVFAVLALGAVGAVSYWGLPDWVPVEQPMFAVEQPDLVLTFPPDQQDRRTLPNGTEYFGASGSVRNVGRETRDVPPILIVLRDARERIVYSWEVTPPRSTLAPGETMSINEAVTDVPRSARFAEIGWKPV
jgi:predicted Zn finger-like uncharacterized protein